MPRVPTSVSDLLQFCSEHAATFTPSPTTLGITAADVTKLKAAVSEAQAAVTAQSATKDAAKAATLTANTKVKNLRTMIGNLVRTIVSFAEAAADPSAVFAAAQLDPTSPRSPSVPPGTPTDMAATLNTDGDLTLKWKCVNPPGGNVVYSITRRIGGTGQFVQVGLVGKREFTDENLPASASNGVTYQIRGVRGTLFGPSSLMFTLQFGNAGGGGLFSVSTEKVPFRVAA